MTEPTVDLTNSAEPKDLTSTGDAEPGSDDGRISLSGLAPEDVLRAMLATPRPVRQD